MTTFDDHDHDTLADRYGVGTARIVDALDAIYARSPAPHALHVTMRQAIRAQTTRPAHPRRSLMREGVWRLGHPIGKRRPLLVAGLVAIALVIGSGVYAAVSLVDDAMSGSPGLTNVVQAYGRAVHIARGACGYTVTLTNLYADRNRVIVGYTLGGPSSRSFVSLSSGWPDVRTARGASLTKLDLGMSQRMDGSVGGHYAAFDARPVAHTRHSLALRVTFPTLTMVEKITGAAPIKAPCETYSDVGMTLTNGTVIRTVTVASRLSFDVAIPINIDERVDRARQVDGLGRSAVALEQVEVTRSEVRLFLRSGPDVRLVPDALVSLDTRGHSRPLQAEPVLPWNPASREQIFNVARPLYDAHGLWLLTVRPNPYAWPRETGGPWIFRIAVP